MGQVTCSLAKNSCPHVNHKPCVNLHDQGHESTTSQHIQAQVPSLCFTTYHRIELFAKCRMKVIILFKPRLRGTRCHTGVKDKNKIVLSSKIMGIDGTVNLDAKLFNY
jgi:hypothetical protein